MFLGMKKCVFAFVLIVSVAVISCKRNLYRVNISSVSVDIEVMRLEEDLFGDSALPVKERAEMLKGKYGSFLQLFSYVINTGEVTNPSWYEYLSVFVHNKMNYEAFGAVRKVYPDIRDIETGLTDAFRHYRYYFPEKIIPSIYTCITGFNNSLIIGDSVIGISLERYLGSDTEFYSRLGIYRYMTLRMDRPFIVPDCMYSWASTEWDFFEAGYGADNLFAHIIHEGKLCYFVRRMLPETSEALIFGFTPEQMRFCYDNEGNMWEYLIEHDLLFTTDQFVIRKLTGTAPFTSYFSNESPGRAAVWLGFRIVDQYMRRNPSVTLPVLMGMTDYQQLLSGARYRP